MRHIKIRKAYLEFFDQRQKLWKHIICLSIYSSVRSIFNSVLVKDRISAILNLFHKKYFRLDQNIHKSTGTKSGQNVWRATQRQRDAELILESFGGASNFVVASYKLEFDTTGYLGDHKDRGAGNCFEISRNECHFKFEF